MMKRISIGLAAMGLMLAACNGDSGAPNGTALTQADANAIGDEMQTEVASINDGASLTNLMAPNFAAPPGALRAFHGPLFFNPVAGCPTFSENPPVDSDSDGVPDNLLLTFDPTICIFSHPGGHAMLVLSGTVNIIDPSTVSRGLRLGFGAFQQKFTVQDTIFFARSVDGAWQFLADSSGFSSIDSTTVTNTSSQHPTSTLAKAWVVNFSADSGSVAFPHWHLPSGDFTINGETTRTRDTVTKTFSVTTVVPLHRDATCQAGNKIVSGEIDVTHTGPDGSATVRIVFNGCGVDPTVTLVT